MIFYQFQVEEAQAALSRKHMQQQELVERADKAETEKLEAEHKLHESIEKVNTLNEEIDKEKKIRKKVRT